MVLGIRQGDHQRGLGPFASLTVSAGVDAAELGLAPEAPPLTGGAAMAQGGQPVVHRTMKTMQCLFRKRWSAAPLLKMTPDVEQKSRDDAGP
jgi:hypothetical protein